MLSIHVIAAKIAFVLTSTCLCLCCVAVFSRESLCCTGWFCNFFNKSSDFVNTDIIRLFLAQPIMSGLLLEEMKASLFGEISACI